MVTRALSCFVLVSCGSNAGAVDASIFMPCHSDSDCPPALPTCHPDSRICVACLPSCMQTCGAQKKCDPVTFTCIPASGNEPCQCNADCPRPGFDPATAIVCDVYDGGICVGCLSNADCVLPDVCQPDIHQCGDGCGICARANQGCDRDAGACFNLDASF